MTSRAWIAIAGGSLLALRWLRRHSRAPRVICDVCFQRVDPGVGTCPHCGAAFGDPNREQHEVAPETWVAGQIARLRAMSYDELLALRDIPQHFEVPVDDGRYVLSGEVEVFWDDPRRGRADLRVMVAIWNDADRAALASEDFIRAPDGSFTGE